MQHPDEGSIHAWLDGQLPRDEAAAVEAHVAECRECADAVAEARGLIAASSRILTALDGVPRDVVPIPSAIGHHPSGIDSTAPAAVGAPSATPATRRARQRWFRGPSLAAAATILVAVGTLTIVRAGNRMSKPAAETAAVSDRADGVAAETAPSAVSVSPPSALPAPSVSAPDAATEARVGNTAGERRGFADRLARDERKEVDAVRPAAPPPPAAASAASAARAPGGGQQQRQRAANEPSEELAKVREQVTPGAAPPADTARVPTVSGARIEAQRASRDTARADFSAKAGAGAVVATGAVRGRVTDANKTALDGALVQVAGTMIGVTTSRTGDFELRGVPAGAQRITARRLGFAPETLGLTVAAGQPATADFTLVPSTAALENVVVTGAGGAGRARQPAAPSGAPARAAQSPTAYGCYDLGITPVTSQSLSDFRQIPRRIALDSVLVPARADGVWYLARDLGGTGRNGVWRPTSADAIEAQWTSGSRTATIRLTGVPGPMLRGTADEIDSARALGASAPAVAAKLPTCPDT